MLACDTDILGNMLKIKSQALAKLLLLFLAKTLYFKSDTNLILLFPFARIHLFLFLFLLFYFFILESGKQQSFKSGTRKYNPDCITALNSHHMQYKKYAMLDFLYVSYFSNIQRIYCSTYIRLVDSSRYNGKRIGK